MRKFRLGRSGKFLCRDLPVFNMTAIPNAPQTARSFSSCSTCQSIALFISMDDSDPDLEWYHWMLAFAFPNDPCRDATDAHCEGGDDFGGFPLRLNPMGNRERRQYQGQEGNQKQVADHIEIPKGLLNKLTCSK